MSIAAERILFWKSSQAVELFGEDECAKALFFWAKHIITNRHYS
jgi:hypothetical protein